MRRFRHFLLLAGVPLSALQAAQPDAVAFGARPSVLYASLSPDGKKVVVIAPMGDRGTRAIVVELGGENKMTPVLNAEGGTGGEITSCRWATNVAIICQLYGIANDGQRKFSTTRLVVTYADGSDFKLLSAPANSRATYNVNSGGSLIDYQGGDGDENSVLLTRWFAPEMAAGSILTDRREGYGVERVDLASLKRRTVVQPNDSAFAYFSDGTGNVRVMGFSDQTGTQYEAKDDIYRYRMVGDSKWQTLSTVTHLGNGLVTGFVPIAVDAGQNVAYGIEGRGGRNVLSSISLDGSLKHEVVLDQGNVDVDGVIKLGRKRRVIGASFATEVRHDVLFDKKLKALQTALTQAMPQLPLISFADASEDENVLLIWAGSDTDPGRYYILNRGTGQLGELLPVRPKLADHKLGQMKPITYTARDGTQIPGYLTLPPGSDGKNLPLVVMPHGGPSARDEWGFDWLSQYFAARGYAVIQPNYRGSSGYGSEWFQLNGFASWKSAIGDVNDAARWAVQQGIADPSKLAIVGWSYGGYAALQSAVVEPDLFKAVVAIAPVTDLNMLREESKDYSDYLRVKAYIGEGPHIQEGSPAQRASEIKVPVLMFHGDLDLNVAVDESRVMNGRLKGAGKQVEYVEYSGLDHSLDDDAVRAGMLEKADNFLRTNMHIK